MAERIIAYGAEIDKLRAEIMAFFDHFNAMEQRIREQGVLNAHVHFKSDRRNTMYLLEPLRGGNRKYIHVGVDPKAQADALLKVERYGQLVKLMRTRGQVERRLIELMAQLQAQHQAFVRLREDAKIFLSRYAND